MNKALLLIICDFLLISVLAMVDFDTPEEDAPPPDSTPEIQEGMTADMIELLQLSLESEEAQRADLAAEKAVIEAARQALEAERKDLQENLQDREEDLTQTKEERDQLKAERKRLEREAAELARQQAELAAAKAASEAQLNASLEATREEREAIAANLKKETQRALALQTELQSRLTALAEAEASVASERERASTLEKKTQQLSTSLQIVQTEREMLTENLKTARTEVEIARVEKQRAEARAEDLAAGVTQLAEQTEAVQEEMRRAQPVSPNEVFSRYDRNRLTLQFTATLPAFLGTREESTTVEAVLVQDGARTFAVFEGSQGPFGLETLERLKGVTGNLVIGSRRLEIVEISFLSADPRILAVEVPSRYLKESKLEAFEMADEPFRFPRAILVSNDLGAYGETEFRLRPGGRQSITVNRSLMSQLRGEFQPSRGDYVFARTGQLLGLMVAGDRGVLLSETGIRPAANLSLGTDFDPAVTNQLQQALSRQLGN